MDRSRLHPRLTAAPAHTAAETGRVVAQALAEALAWHRAGNVARAAELYGAILALEPRHPDALHLCGVIAHQQGAYGLARTWIERALAVAPRSAEAHNSMGAACQAAGDRAAAEASFRQALALRPDYPEAWQNLGLLHEGRGQPGAALDCYRRAVGHGGRNPGLMTRFALALCEDDCAADAVALFDEVLRDQPGHRGALLGLGEARYTLGQLRQASACFERVLELDPESAPGWIGLGTVLLAAAEWRSARECFERVLTREPQHAQARWNRALACLAGGDLEQGWRDFGWRWASREWDSVTRHYGAERWTGAALDGRSILLWREQGLGDELLFCSLVPDIAGRAARCVLECEPRLVALLQRSFPTAEVVAGGYPPHPATAAHDIDWHAPIGDLAPLLRPSIASFPGAPAYLRADPERVRRWRERLAGLGAGPRIGVCWRSSNTRGVRAAACTRIEQWLPVLGTPGATFVNLQYDRCERELAQARLATGRPIACFPELDMRNDLDETAALIAALDLVVSAPTTVSILAGALGTPTWQLTCGADWQALGQSGSPWQPRLTRFYRRWDEDWETILQELAAALAGWIGEYAGLPGSPPRFGSP